MPIPGNLLIAATAVMPHTDVDRISARLIQLRKPPEEMQTSVKSARTDSRTKNPLM